MSLLLSGELFARIHPMRYALENEDILAQSGNLPWNFVVAMDWSIVNNALPSIQRDLGASLGELQWMVNAFGLAMASTMVTMGRFADAYGRRKFLSLGLSFAL